MPDRPPIISCPHVKDGNKTDKYFPISHPEGVFILRLCFVCAALLKEQVYGEILHRAAENVAREKGGQ